MLFGSLRVLLRVTTRAVATVNCFRLTVGLLCALKPPQGKAMSVTTS